MMNQPKGESETVWITGYANYAVQCRTVASDYPTKEQESPAVADKRARRESMPKIAPIGRAYNVVADNTGPITGLSSFV